ncbi:MAG: phosphoribosylanthranilate isomerase [Candidatus Dormiibacterota bacterium]
MKQLIDSGADEFWPASRWPTLGGPQLSNGGTRVKICGCTSATEVDAAVTAGADAVGLIFAPSPRRITPEQGALATAAVPPRVSVVGVFIDPSPDELEHAMAVLPRLTPQFSGSEPLELCRYLGVPYLKVFPVSAEEPESGADLATALKRYPEALPMFETASRQRGGSGLTFEWSAVASLVKRRPAVISGGLNPGNVGECVRQLRPYAVDVRSGVESGGAKDPVKLGDFISAVRRAHATS